MAFTKKTEVAPQADTETEVTEQPNTLPNIDGASLAEHAGKLGAKVSKDTEATIDVVSKAKEDWQGGPFPVMFRLQADFKSEELDGFAVPNSDTGNNPDEFKVPKENNKGKVSLVATNFYKEFAHKTPAGSAYLARIEWCARMEDKNAMKDDVPDDIRAMNPMELEQHSKWCQTRISSMIAAYKDAMALYFKSAEVQAYPGVSCEPLWVKGKEGVEVQSVRDCIQLWITPEEGKPIAKWAFFSIKSFLRLNTKKALEKGGTFNHLVESGATPKKKPDGSVDTPVGHSIETLETGLSYLAELHDWTDRMVGTKDQVDYGKFLKLMNAKGNDELIVAAVELRNFLNDAIKATGGDAKYTAIQSSGSDLTAQATKQAA